MWRPLAVVLLCTVAAGCGPSALRSLPVPPGAMIGTRGIEFADGAHLKLDVWQPASPGHGHRPVVVWLYGGYWIKTSRADYRPLAYPFTSAGCVVVIPDYRISPGVHFPTFIDDAASAVAWAHRHAAEFGGDPNRIFLAGHSAGAYIALMLTLDPRYLERHGVPPQSIRGAISLSAPTHFTPNGDPLTREVFGADKKTWPQTQPENFIHDNEPPILLIQGDQDELVKPGSNRYLADRIQAKGGRATAVTYPKMGHHGPLVSLIWPLWTTADVRAWCIQFIRQNGGS